jgi:hypothetical protein
LVSQLCGVHGHNVAHIPPFEVSHQELRRHTFSGDEMEGRV